MAKYHWERTTFTGIHTEQAKAENGAAYALDMANLRIDGDGWLQPRSAISEVGSGTGAGITGIAATPTHIFILRQGRLFVREADALETETALSPVDGLSGRISVADFTTYAILTSEGSDSGYMIVLEAGERYLEIYTLLPAEPGRSAIAANWTAIDSFDGGLSRSSYSYRATYLSEQSGTPWFGLETNAPNFGATPGLSLSAHDNAVRITVAHSPDTRITGVNIYRAIGPIPINIDGETGGDWFLVGTINKPDTRLTDTLSDEDLAEKSQLKTTNSPLPSEVKQLYKYNDRIFAPVGDRLIYSDLDFGNIVPWAYPADNDIRTGKRVDWCAEINEILLFGSREGTWRLTGGTEYDFAVGQISGQGAIDAHAWGKISSGLAFVGEAGLFVTDASQVVEISDIILDGYFRDRKAVRGGVVFFKDNNILFTVTLKDKDDNEVDYQFKREDGYWTRWNLDFRQADSIVEDNEATRVLVADDTGQLKRLDWNSTDINEDTEWLFESHSIDLEVYKIANDLKRFSMLQFTGDTDNEMTLTAFKDDETTPVLSINFNSRASSLKPVRVPINRFARRLRFRLQGTGRCKIQGLKLEIIK